MNPNIAFLLVFSLVLASCTAVTETPNKADMANQSLPVNRDCRPQYPRQAAIERIEGWVELEFLVGQDGFPIDITVVAAEPEGVFEEVAIRSFRCWQFPPEQSSLEYRQRHTLDFKLENKR